MTDKYTGLLFYNNKFFIIDINNMSIFIQLLNLFVDPTQILN